MKLFYSSTSPYARKVRLLVLEKGLAESVEMVTVDTANPSPELLAANPLGKIPALALDNGNAVFDSPVICRYLDGLAQPYFLPRAGQAELDVLCWEAVADGIADAAYNLVMELRGRPENERSPRTMQRWAGEITRTLHYVDARVATLGDEINLAHLALAAAVGYVDFRLPQLLRDSGCTQLLGWYENFRTRPSMQATLPG